LTWEKLKVDGVEECVTLEALALVMGREFVENAS